jgi:lon-related putative ATP-dependent protease
MTKLKPAKHQELKPEDLRWNCDPSIFEFESTGDLEPMEGIIGQERALKAIRVGVDLRSPGYNIFIAGLSGSGKMTTVKRMLEKISSNCPPLYDYAYVNNFKDPDLPLLLTFPIGKARQFKQDLGSAIQILKNRIPQTLDSDHFTERRKRLVQEYNEKEQKLMTDFDQKLKADDFTLVQVKSGDGARPDIYPLIEEKPVPIFQLDEKIKEGKITKDKAKELINKYNELQQDLNVIFKEGLQISQNFEKKILELEKSAVEMVVKSVIDNIHDRHKDEKVADFIEQVENNIMENIQVFKGLSPQGQVTPEGFEIDYFKEYDVNIILDNSESTECPVIVETSPNFTNLFGTIEKVSDGRGGWYSDFTKIKSGSILKANGGYLVLNVLHLFEEPGVWRTLKRVLTYNKLEIQESPNLFQFTSSILKPEPIDIDTKIILIGSDWIYSLLAEREYDFKKMFKIKADFDYEIKRSDKVIVEYARVIKKLIKEEGLCEFDRSAIAQLIEISARFAGQKYKLTTRFSQIADVAREANFWALDDGFNVVSEAHVKKAYELARDRHGLLESKVDDMLHDEMILLDTEGERVGQINGLAVYSTDYYSFGRPTRITATVSLGSGSIINVEREAGMSGRHYNKGVLIISGYFRETFGQEMPLSFNANLVFEQSYGTVDGDSASCAEIFALLSTLADLPLKQYLAVTGSLNQKGDVQPIGGVNEKIEGFFDLCKGRGLNKRQGVVIPVQNVKELMLKEEVVEAVAKGEFHIYPISKVEEGIELVTGVLAGKKSPKGYPPGTVFYLVEKKIRYLYARSKAIRPDGNNKTPAKKPRR